MTSATVQQLTGAPRDRNTLDAPDPPVPRSFPVGVSGGTVTLGMPAGSASVVVLS